MLLHNALLRLNIALAFVHSIGTSLLLHQRECVGVLFKLTILRMALSCSRCSPSLPDSPVLTHTSENPRGRALLCAGHSSCTIRRTTAYRPPSSQTVPPCAPLATGPTLLRFPHLNPESCVASYCKNTLFPLLFSAFERKRLEELTASIHGEKKSKSKHSSYYTT